MLRKPLINYGIYLQILIMDMEPIYIRKSEAEVLWEKRQQALANDAVTGKDVK